jgi:hypothetical protein
MALHPRMRAKVDALLPVSRAVLAQEQEWLEQGGEEQEEEGQRKRLLTPRTEIRKGCLQIRLCASPALARAYTSSLKTRGWAQIATSSRLTAARLKR